MTLEQENARLRDVLAELLFAYGASQRQSASRKARSILAAVGADL
jgi:hypothetical protein